MEKKETTSSFSNSYLSWEFFLTGGMSILVCLATWAFVDKSASLYTVGQLAFALAFAVNHPHFLSSYILMYRDFRKNILSKPRYAFSGIVVPILLATALLKGLFTPDPVLLGHIVNVMFFLVGWHYVKQVFGFVVVSSAQRKIYYLNWERRLLMVNLISVWMMSSLATHVTNGSYQFYQITHFGLGLSPEVLKFTYWVVGLTFLATVAMQIQKYVREGHKPAPPAVAAYLALYAWYLPTTSHPAFGYLIPFFHSLQYLTFVWLMKRNQVQYEISALKDREWREAWVSKIGGFALGALFLGAMFFEFIPKALDSRQLVAGEGMGSSPILAAFLLFINIHHYFIDNAIWRSDNEVVKKHLVQGLNAAPEEKSKNASRGRVA